MDQFSGGRTRRIGPDRGLRGAGGIAELTTTMLTGDVLCTCQGFVSYLT